MFEDMTYENIMAQMMEDMPDGLNTEEGSLIWNACAKQALQLEEAYLALQRVEDNLYTDTQDEDHLILNGKDKGVEIKEASNAILKAHFLQEIEIGSRFTANDMDYVVEELISGFDYKIMCEESGKTGNIANGELTPIDFIDDYQGGSIVEILIPGTDMEDIELYRERILSLNNSIHFGGNRADYKRFIGELSGVGAVKLKRRSLDDPFIYPYVIDAEYNVPSEELIEAVQLAVDPVQNHGDGDGIAPIGHNVLIKPAVGVPVNITSEILYDEGYSQESLQTQINNVIDKYLLELKKTWGDAESLLVRIAQIDSRLLAIEGILDISNTKINGEKANLHILYEEIPVRGSVNGI